MALNSMLRRATSTQVPLAIRAVRSSRSFHSTISTVFCVEKGAWATSSVGGRFATFLRFSTVPNEHSSDESLIRVLESEIECAESEEPTNENILENMPDGFPFEIQDTPGERTITLKGQYKDEIIKMEIDMPTPAEEDEDDNNHDEENIEPSIPLVVNVSKGNGLFLEFGVTAYADEITIDSLSIKQPECSKDELAYEGPDFNDLDENLQKAFHKYLEIRGIKPTTTNFLVEYMNNKDSREYSQWLKNLKNFIEK